MESAINRLEVINREWENCCRNEETLPYQCSTIPDTSNHIEEKSMEATISRLEATNREWRIIVGMKNFSLLMFDHC